jgi:hypothetical protein
VNQGRNQGGREAADCSSFPNRNLEDKGLIETPILYVLRDLPFSRNQLLNSDDD